MRGASRPGPGPMEPDGATVKRLLIRTAAEFFQRFVARSRLVARLFFGVWLRPAGGADYYFDLTTPVLAWKASESIRAETYLVDLGTGAVAVLGLSFWARKGCEVTSCDIAPVLTELAGASVEYVGAPVRVVQSDFFEAADRPFDVVTLNAPYVSTATGTARGLSGERRSQWDGGADGVVVIRAFLDRLAEDPHSVVAYLGVNGLHVSPNAIRPLVEARSGVELREVYRLPLVPVDVYVIDHPEIGDGTQ